MTREEAINVITNADLSKVEDRVIKAIFYLCTNKALEQESCDDAISRQAINELQKYRYNCGDTTITCVSLASINELPSVTHKTGHWIKIKPYPLQMHDYECSECGHETDDNTENYCSECGTKMEVSKYE
jgi:hypothetical protein